MQVAREDFSYSILQELYRRYSSSRTRTLGVKLAVCVISHSDICSTTAQISNNENATVSSTAVDEVCILKPIQTVTFFTNMLHLSNQDMRMTWQRDAYTSAKRLFIEALQIRSYQNQFIVEESWKESLNYVLNATQLESC